MTVHFSKTERLDHTYWLATISPADMRKNPQIGKGDYVSDQQFFGRVEEINGSTLKLWCRCKFPCVGRAYNIEKK